MSSDERIANVFRSYREPLVTYKMKYIPTFFVFLWRCVEHFCYITFLAFFFLALLSFIKITVVAFREP